MTKSVGKLVRDRRLRVAEHYWMVHLRRRYCLGGPFPPSSLEKKVCSTLCKWELPHDHQPRRFPVNLNGLTITYTPDISVGGLLLEPHGDLDDPKFIPKMTAFKHDYPGEHVVLITDAYGISKVPAGIFDAIIATQEMGNLRPFIRNFTRRTRESALSVGRGHK